MLCIQGIFSCARQGLTAFAESILYCTNGAATRLRIDSETVVSLNEWNPAINTALDELGVAFSR
jgi:hypothetical protein